MTNVIATTIKGLSVKIWLNYFKQVYLCPNYFLWYSQLIKNVAHVLAQVRTGFSSTCPLFLCALSFDGITKRVLNYLNQVLKVLFLNSLVHNLLFEFCTGIFSGKHSTVLVKTCAHFCLWFLGVSPEIPFYIFTYQKNSQKFKGFFMYPISGVDEIDFFTVSIKYTKIY